MGFLGGWEVGCGEDGARFGEAVDGGVGACGEEDAPGLEEEGG